MPWLAWTLIAVFANGVWGTIARPLVARLGWRLVAAMNTLGYALPIPLIWLIARPPLDGLTLVPAMKAVSVGLFSQLGVVMIYQALSSGGKTAAVIPITALFPLVTITGAVFFLNESPSIVQLFGALLAVAAVALISLGGRPEAEAATEEPLVGISAPGLESEHP